MDNKGIRQAVMATVSDGPVDPTNPSAPSSRRTEVQVQHEEFSGPLPSPEVLKRYSEAFENGAERIFEMAEREQAHRHTQESRIVLFSGSGTIFAFVLGMTATVGGLWLVHSDKPISGFAFFFSGAGSLVAAFFYDRKKAKEPVENPPVEPKVAPTAKRKTQAGS